MSHVNGEVVRGGAMGTVLSFIVLDPLIGPSIESSQKGRALNPPIE